MALRNHVVYLVPMPALMEVAPLIDDVTTPIVLAPLAGGPATPALTAAVVDTGAFGFLAGGYLTADRLAADMAELRSLTSRPFGVNIFVPPAAPADPLMYAPFVADVGAWAEARGLPVGEPRFSDDGFAEKMQLLTDDPVRVVSFTFGMPPDDSVRQLHAAGSQVWVTITSQAEARAALRGGADALVVQGTEAGGHRGSFDDADPSPDGSLPALLDGLRGIERPLIATGGIMSGTAIAAALESGASAAQLGTAFLLCPEAGTSEPHRQALRQATVPTRFTRAFTGRAARGIVNAFMEELEGSAVSAYPEIHHVTQPLRRSARAAGDASAINLWAGERYGMTRELPAADLLEALASEAGLR
jgi:nitronate monooxygenase